jgi:hypothetical protein
MPKPIAKPPRAEEVLAAVAARYPAGATVTQVRPIGLSCLTGMDWS